MCDMWYIPAIGAPPGNGAAIGAPPGSGAPPGGGAATIYC